jgi:hypothetical protein
MECSGNRKANQLVIPRFALVKADSESTHAGPEALGDWPLLISVRAAMLWFVDGVDWGCRTTKLAVRQRDVTVVAARSLEFAARNPRTDRQRFSHTIFPRRRRDLNSYQEMGGRSSVKSDFTGGIEDLYVREFRRFLNSPPPDRQDLDNREFAGG